jgi:hypothetical protein
MVAANASSSVDGAPGASPSFSVAIAPIIA